MMSFSFSFPLVFGAGFVEPDDHGKVVGGNVFVVWPPERVIYPRRDCIFVKRHFMFLFS